MTNQHLDHVLFSVAVAGLALFAMFYLPPRVDSPWEHYAWLVADLGVVIASVAWGLTLLVAPRLLRGESSLVGSMIFFTFAILVVVVWLTVGLMDNYDV